ncbi:methylmalonyl-CoA mutase family protein [Chloroflexota bacterium]
MTEPSRLEDIERKRKEWEEGPLKQSLRRFGVEESPNRFYTPLDIKDYDFLNKVGFPGEYPFTAHNYAAEAPVKIDGQVDLVRAGAYSGYGTPEDTRDYYKYMQSRGRRGGPNIAFDLPTQCGYDSDDPVSQGEVGKVGVAVDTLNDVEIIYEAFTGDNELDKIASNFTINAPANVILAMYVALAKKRGIPLDKLKGTPQNDILKEFVARGTYIFPPKPSMRMVRDTITYCRQHMRSMNAISISMYHIREAGATAPQSLGFCFSNAIAYIQLGIDAGLDVDDFIPCFTWLPQESGSMDILGEIAKARAARRLWAKIMRERFGSKDPKNWRGRGLGNANIGNYNRTVGRPLTNLTRVILGMVACALAGGDPFSGAPPGGFPYDEALGLGHSLEAVQLNMDSDRIIRHEAKLREVIDPFAGSYYIESLTNKIEEEALAIIRKIDAMGGAAAAIEQGYMQREVTNSAYERQKRIEKGEEIIVGENAFLGEHELEVDVSRVIPHPYDPAKRADAEKKQLANLAKVKRERDDQAVQANLKRLADAAHDESINLIPPIFEAVEAYASIGEICQVLRGVFGEYQSQGVGV